jgi:uncharacterized membrane protein YraQ (UPF0718 family)
MFNVIDIINQPSFSTKLYESAEMFLQLFTELTVLFLAISFAVALINQKLPAKKIQRILGAHKGRGYFVAAGLGAVTPFCSCSTIPMLIGLLKARAGFGPTMTFLFTSPLLNPIVIVLFIPVLGPMVTFWYAMLALTVSILAGVFLQMFNFDRYIKQDMLQTPNGGGCKSKADDSPTPAKLSWSAAWDESWSMFKTMFPFMLIAMLIGALVHGFVPTSFFAEVAGADNPAAIPTAALIGIPLYLRVTALLPLIGSFLAKGVSMGAIIALVIGSGGASLPEMILLRRLFHWQLLVAFLVVVFFMAIIGGFGFNAFFG